MTQLINTSTATGATTYSTQRKLDRTSNGVLWAIHSTNPATVTGGTSNIKCAYSTDDGATWTDAGWVLSGSGGTTSNYTNSGPGSLFIDIDDYAHLVFKDFDNGYVYYRRGTPNAARTSYTWSAATRAGNADAFDYYPDVVAHREGTGWKVHIVRSRKQSDGYNSVGYWRFNIDSAGTLTTDEAIAIYPAVGGSLPHFFPSIDFNHTGDGKAVKDGTPDLYVAWSAGGTGTGKGIRFRKAAYSAGSWTWGTEQEIDTTRYVYTDQFWVNCLFDGTRVVLPGQVYDGTNVDIILYERDAADTTTTTRVLSASAANADRFTEGSASYDSSGNVYLVGRTDGTTGVHYKKWTRANNSLGDSVLVDTTNISSPRVSVKRGYSDNRIEFIYTDGTASPYEVKYSYVGDPEPELYPANVDESTSTTATAFSNQRKLDRTSNNVLWSVYADNDGSDLMQAYSTDEGVTWTSSLIASTAGTVNNYTPNLSFFIDIDDYAHLVEKRATDGYIYYRRGTPNASRTAYTWSPAATVYNSSALHDYPNVVAHPEGTGWVAHVTSSLRNGTGTQYAEVFRVNIAADGTMTSTQVFRGSVYASGNAHTWPSIDFNHTGDGKTVAGGTPHLYVAWSNGATGTGGGIRFVKATYSAGTWTWGTEREIDTLRYVPSSTYWLNCLFDGTQVLIAGELYDGASADVVIYERDAADTTTTVRVAEDNVSSASGTALNYGSMSYFGDDLFLMGGQATTPQVLVYRRWSRSTGTLGPAVVVDDTIGRDNPYISARRASTDSVLEFIYGAGGTSPYSITYNQVVLNVLPTVTINDIGAVIDPRVATEITWSYFDADSEPQTSYEIGYRKVGDTNWTTEQVNGSQTSHSIAAGVLTDESDYELRVRANDGIGWGEYDTITFRADSWTYGAEATSKVNYRELITSRKPVGYWRLGESSGTTAFDHSGNKHHGTYIDSPTLGVAGAIVDDSNTGAYFPASSGARAEASVGDYSVNGGFTIEFWANMPSTAVHSGMYPYIASDLGWPGWLIHGSSDNSNLVFQPRPESGTYGGGVAVTLDLDTWTHVAYTLDSSGQGRAYKNGTLVASPTLPWPGYIVGNLKMGGWSSANALDCSLDEFAIYDRVLSADEVAENYSSGQAAAQYYSGSYRNAVMLSEPASYWPLSEPAGATVAVPEVGVKGTYANSKTTTTSPIYSDGDSALSASYITWGTGLAADTGWSLENWVKWTSPPDLGSWNTIMSITLPGTDMKMQSDTDPNGNLRCRVDTPGNINQVLSTGVNVKDGTWHHTVLTYSHETRDVYLYLDGAKFGPLTIVGDPLPKTANGGSSGSGTLWHLDEPAVYGRELTEQEVNLHYQASQGATSIYTGLGYQNYADIVKADEPVGYWRLGEASGTTAVDSSGNGFDGTYTGTLTLGATGAINNDTDTAMELAGTGADANFVDLGNPTELQITGSQTIEMWLYPSVLNDGVRRNPFNKAYGGEGTITQEPTGNLNYYYGTSGANTTPYSGFNSSANVLTQGKWHHVVVVRDLDNMKVRWFINGVETATYDAPYAAATASTYSAMIGDGYVEEYAGKIDEVAVYNRALTSKEIAAHYNAGIEYGIGMDELGEYEVQVRTSDAVGYGEWSDASTVQVSNKMVFSNGVWTPARVNIKAAGQLESGVVR